MAARGALTAIGRADKIYRHFPVTKGNFFCHQFFLLPRMDDVTQLAGSPTTLAIDVHEMKVLLTVPEVRII